MKKKGKNPSISFFLILLLLVGVVYFMAAPPVFAMPPSRQFFAQTRQEKPWTSFFGLFRRGWGRFFARVVKGKVTSINGSTLMVMSSNGMIFTVQTDSSTRFLRHFWGRSSLQEINVGDLVNVYGRYTDENHTTIQARLIRDLSNTVRPIVGFGIISTIGSNNSISLSTKKRGVIVIYITPSTVIIDRDSQPISFASLQLGQRLRVRGLWDKTKQKITQVKEIKDFSLPPRSK